MVTKYFRKTDILSRQEKLRSYLNRLLQSFLYARTVTKSWCSVGMFFWQIQKFQIHKLVSRCDHLNISTMYSVFWLKRILNIIIQAGIFRDYRNTCFWRPKCFGKAIPQIMTLWDIKRERSTSDYAVSEIRREMSFFSFGFARVSEVRHIHFSSNDLFYCLVMSTPN